MTLKSHGHGHDVLRAYCRSMRLHFGAVIFALAFVLAPVARGDVPHESQGLRSLFRQFQSAVSLSFQSSVVVELHAADASDSPEFQKAVGTPVKGEVEFRAAGDHYHFISRAEADKLPGLTNSVAFDGNEFQLFFGGPRILSTSAQEKAGALAMLPNPLIELLQFRYPVTDQNEGRDVRFRDVQEDQVPDSFWAVTWSDETSSAGNSGPLKRAEFPGGSYQGQSYVHHVYVPSGAGGRPVRIDRVASGGQVLTSLEIGDYETIGSGSAQTCWPRWFRMVAFQPNGAPAVTLTFELTSLWVNADVSDRTFRISAPVRVRWDDDQRVFVPTPDPG